MVAVVDVGQIKWLLGFLLTALHVLGECLHLACNVAHSAAHLHGIGSDNGVFSFLRIVKHLHHIPVHTFNQREVTKVNPSASTHLLVHHKIMLAIKSIYAISHIGGTVGQRLVADIHCVGAGLRHNHIP